MHQNHVPSQVRVVIVGDQGVVREGLKILLEREGTVKVVAVAADGLAAIHGAIVHKPDVVVIDLMLPALDGIDVARRILDALPETRIVVLSTCNTPDYVFSALQAGARGYVVEANPGAELVGAVTPIQNLSRREREVLRLTVSGSSSAETAQQLCISRKTVDTYRSRLMGKLGVKNVVTLIHFAVANGMAPAQCSAR